MKRSRPRYEALSSHSNRYNLQDCAAERPCASNAQESVYAECFEDAIGSMEALDPLQRFLGTSARSYGQANTVNQSDIASTNFDNKSTCLETQQPLRRTQQSDDDFRFDMANYTERSGSFGANYGTRKPHQHFLCASAAPHYNTTRESRSVTSQRSTVTPMPNPPAASTELSESRPTSYGCYRGLFLDSDEARDHRHMSTRFGRQPYIHPEDDPSILEIENDRRQQVGRIYDAMIRADRARDNSGSIAMKRWVHAAHYKPDLVEAFAHKVFDCLLIQVKEGFRGWHHNDYVDDDRKGEKEDRDADCMARLENIIDALEREKTICEDVVNSASQIRMFVNAPIAYAARKYQNRVGNSKRGRTKDLADSNPRPTKLRRIGGRPTRGRSTTASEVPPSRDTTPHFQTPDTAAMPYFATASSRQLVSSPPSTYMTPRQTLQRPTIALPQAHAGYRQANATVPPTTTQPATSSPALPRPAMSPPALPPLRSYSPHLPTHIAPSTPSLSYTYHSAPPSPDALKYPLSTNSPSPWPTAPPHGLPAYTPIDPSLSSSDLLLPQHAWPDTNTLTPAPVNDGVTFFDQHDINHVSLAELEHAPLHTVSGDDGDAGDFESFWNELPGVQTFSFGERE